MITYHTDRYGMQVCPVCGSTGTEAFMPQHVMNQHGSRILRKSSTIGVGGPRWHVDLRLEPGDHSYAEPAGLLRPDEVVVDPLDYCIDCGHPRAEHHDDCTGQCNCMTFRAALSEPQPKPEGTS